MSKIEKPPIYPLFFDEQIKQIRPLQIITKIEALANYCLVKVDELLKPETLKGRSEALLLIQIAQNLWKIQGKLETLKRCLKKNPSENSNSGNFQG
jgi:hypothetical protein